VNLADWLILAVLAVSLLIGFVRGFVAEAVALLAWVAAVAGALNFGPTVAEWFAGEIALPSARLILAYASVFFLILLLGAMTGWLLRQLVHSSGLSGTDRLLGLLFGLARGIAVAALAVFLAGFTPLARDPWWRESRFIPPLERVARWMAGFLPAGASAALVLPAEEARPPPAEPAP
jgi:membrane protein required for colicin V production